jgi:hypothetical protein
LFRRGTGAAGWLAFPFMLFFELLGPLIELAGYLFMFLCFFAGVLSTTAWIAFLVVAIGLGVLLSVSALLLEELWFHVYPRLGDIVLLFVLAVAENFGYRQLNSVWRLIGLLRWMRGGKAQWGTMARKASWNRSA